MRAKKKKNPFTGIRTYVIERELERRNSIAYARNVNAEFRARNAFERERSKRPRAR
jgi:hypothetical protein